MTPFVHTARFGILVPVKPPRIAKSRLVALGHDLRARLVVAFALDTVAAAVASTRVERVVAVTDDFRLAATLRSEGAEVIPDGTTDDLNGTLHLAALEVARTSPDLRLGAVCADLPALTPHGLDLALAAASEHALAFVADAEGVGTTAYFSGTAADFRPWFGRDSRRAHLDEGAVELEVDVPVLRRDVDTPADLRAAVGLGLGRYTTEALAGLSL
jgi:2-phospho-L-lactate guanylyltransferase